jgi:hypothetical protein
MNSIKCKNCGLNNFPTDIECRRCRTSFQKSSKVKEERSRSRFSIWSLLLLALLAGVAYYAYDGTLSSMDKVNANDAKRVASQPAERPLAPGLSRTEYDRQKSQTYGDAVRGSQSLADHDKNIQRTEKMMQQISNGTVGK